jgi:hypothetical protein
VLGGCLCLVPVPETSHCGAREPCSYAAVQDVLVQAEGCRRLQCFPSRLRLRLCGFLMPASPPAFQTLVPVPYTLFHSVINSRS